jgi:hypothetical protein
MGDRPGLQGDLVKGTLDVLILKSLTRSRLSTAVSRVLGSA